jgi:threonine aldolase
LTARRGFASDNAATIHPEVIAAISRANEGHAFGYGHDPVTEALADRFHEQFGERARAFPVWGGTGANVLCLRAACRPWDAVVCAETAHLNADECGAPEAIAGVKLLTAATEDGKLTPELVEQRLGREGDEHAVQPRVVSISQCTELGTVYRAAELSALVDHAHARGLLVHVDGARLANAAAALELPLRALSTDAGVDMLSFGGTKNGLLGAEAVVFLEPGLAEGFEYLRKQSNAMARLLAERVRELPRVRITRPVQANAVFAVLPQEAIVALLERFDFYVWDEAASEVRWMCSWDTTEEDVEEFAAAVAEAVA